MSTKIAKSVRFFISVNFYNNLSLKKNSFFYVSPIPGYWAFNVKTKRENNVNVFYPEMKLLRELTNDVFGFANGLK